MMNGIKLDACPECDLLLKQAQAEPGDKVHCPRCGYLLQRVRSHSVEKTLALSLTGLVLIFPANLLPLVGIKILGKTQDGTLWSGVAALLDEDMWAVAILVFFSSILFPLLSIILSLLISAHLYFKRYNRHLVHWMRWMQHLDEWAMLEVYTLGIIVACVKLAAMAELRFGFGLYTFTALLLVTGMLSSSLDEYLFWQSISRLRKEEDHHET